MKGFKTIVAGLAMMLAVTGTANAATFQIQFSGVDIVYTQATGNFDEPGAIDPLTTMTFLIDGAGFIDFAQGFLAACDASQHLIGQVDLKLDGNKATGEVYFIAHHRITENGEKKYTMAAAGKSGT